MTNHLALIGLNYQNKRSTGDKNFWVDMLPFFSGTIKKISIISIRQELAEQEEKTTNGTQFITYFMSPFFLETRSGSGSRNNLFWRGGAFPAKFAIIEKVLSAQRICAKLEAVNKETPLDHIHLMDNFGFGNRLITNKAAGLNSTVSISAMTYMGRNSVFYNVYHKLSFKKPNLYVIPYSETHRHKLLSLGLAKQKLKRIPWGVLAENGSTPDVGKDELKAALGIRPGLPLFLWAGYIQQINREDFNYAYQMAKQATGMGLKAHFVFAFKPECLEKGMEEMSTPEITVRETTAESFELFKRAADVFYSPITNFNSIVAPPLTWLEMLAKGVPIITTNVPGANEVIEDGVTGFSVEGNADMIEKLFLMGERFMNMKDACIQKIADKYNIKVIAGEYLNFWNSLKVN